MPLSFASSWVERVRSGWVPEPDLERDPSSLVLSFGALPAGMVRAEGELEELGDRYAAAVRDRRAAEQLEKPIRAELAAAVAELGCEQLIGPSWLVQIVTDKAGRRSLRFRADS